jgi:hypothetical protein
MSLQRCNPAQSGYHMVAVEPWDDMALGLPCGFGTGCWRWNKTASGGPHFSVGSTALSVWCYWSGAMKPTGRRQAEHGTVFPPSRYNAPARCSQSLLTVDSDNPAFASQRYGRARPFLSDVFRQEKTIPSPVLHLIEGAGPDRVQ